jgi:hypothetical protein
MFAQTLCWNCPPMPKTYFTNWALLFGSDFWSGNTYFLKFAKSMPNIVIWNGSLNTKRQQLNVCIYFILKLAYPCPKHISKWGAAIRVKSFAQEAPLKHIFKDSQVIGFGAMRVNTPSKSIRFGDTHGPKPHIFRGSRWPVMSQKAVDRGERTKARPRLTGPSGWLTTMEKSKPEPQSDRFRLEPRYELLHRPKPHVRTAP